MEKPEEGMNNLQTQKQVKQTETLTAGTGTVEFKQAAKRVVDYLMLSVVDNCPDCGKFGLTRKGVHLYCPTCGFSVDVPENSNSTNRFDKDPDRKVKVIRSGAWAGWSVSVSILRHCADGNHQDCRGWYKHNESQHISECSCTCHQQSSKNLVDGGVSKN